MSSVRVRRSQQATARAVRITVRGIVPIVFALGMWYLLTHVVRFGYVVSDSMLPTLQVGDYYTLRLDAYRRHPPQRGDIIVFTGPEGEPYVKRVIALPGEVVQIAGGIVSINDRPLREPYLKERPQPERPVRDLVPPDRYVVLGDNRNLSADSRDLGFIGRERIMGRATRIIWPLSHARWLTAPAYSPAT